MSAFFGTGWYRIDDNRSVYVFRVPPRQTISTAGFDSDGKRKLGIEIQYPVSFGLHKLDDLPDFIEFENYGTVSFTPGIQIEVPITEKWALRPYAHIGYGYEKQSRDNAWIYYGGIKSRYHLREGRSRLSLLNGIYFAGYNPDFGSRGKFGSVMAGLEYDHPTPWTLGGDTLFMNWHFTYNWMFDRLNFHVDPERSESVRDQFEFGIALGKGSKKWKIGFLKFEHVGLSFQWSSDADLAGITFNLRSPFTN